ncbi:hypothetical protein BC828DRAFT_351823 [Blastocladiella britannica]|nr:hypothetical protein BC828DRAFT_351823 [Blastocladiella britannica]
MAQAACASPGTLPPLYSILHSQRNNNIHQVDPEASEQTQKVFEGTYNIWYNKWTGQPSKKRFGERAPTRVNIPRDTGFTLADKRRKQNPNHRTSICLMFARGNCHKGHKCEFYHRIPLPEDPEETTKDCFGRTRHRDEKDDMNGVGSFNRENRTVYIGGMHPYEKGDAEKVIRKHFLAYGTIDRLNVIYDKSIAFVRFSQRHPAEFAKEAMDHQALDAGEVIRIRWAHDDPNPAEIERARKRKEREFVDSYVAKKARTGEVEFMDDDMRKIIEANPTYQKYYAYYQAPAAASSAALLVEDGSAADTTEAAGSADVGTTATAGGDDDAAAPEADGDASANGDGAPEAPPSAGADDDDDE